jgi:hypothetical protein
MTPAQRAKRIYQCSNDDEFEDMQEQRLEVAVWKAATVHLRQPPAPLEPEHWKMAIAYFKKSLQVGSYYCLPTFFFAQARSFASLDTRRDVFTTARSPVSQALVAVDDVPACFPWESLGDMVFFIIKHVTPEKRVHVQQAHLHCPRSTIQVCVCEIADLIGPTADSMLLSVDGGTTVELDVMVWATYMRQVLGSMYRWSLMRYRPVYEFIEQPSLGEPCWPAINDAHQAAIALPEGQIIPAAPPPANPLSTDEAISFVTTCVARSALVGEEAAVRLSELNLHPDLAQSLWRAGALAIVQIEDEYHCRLQRSAVEWTAKIQVANPMLAMQVPPEASLLKCAKLDLIMRLKMEGWDGQVAGLKLEDWAPNRAQIFRNTETRPLSYFAALLRRFDIVDRGATAIAHTRPDAYYRALLFLSRSALTLMLALEDEEQDDAWYRKHLKDCPGGNEGESGDERDPPPADDLIALMGDQQHAIGRRPERVRWLRQLIDIGPGTAQVKIHFDHASPSGDQKGFCPCASSGACRWQQCRSHATLRDYCAAMYAWHQPQGADIGTDRAAHMDYDPPTAHVRYISEHARMTPF